ncbi:aldolase catalytic domain-containing protein [Peijinzhouia sedimentorum]
MSVKFNILDCTLRDGGYYTNWDFDQQLVDKYLNSCNHLPIEYLEVGYRSKPMIGYLGKYYYCPVSVLRDINLKSNKKLAIILNEKDISEDDINGLLIPIKEYVKLIRIAIDPKNFQRAICLAKAIKKLDFEIAFNVMYMSTWKDQKEFLNLLPKVDGLVEYFYMVDSFGGVYPEDVRQIIELVRSKTKVKLGFHGHNNLEMALANTLVAIEEGIDIVDSTFTGMGRGAGNLKTELLLTALQAKGKLEFDYNALTSVVDGFSQLQTEYNWGTNLPYMVSGANSLPQKQVMEWVGKRYYSFNSIIRALNNQSQGKVDNESLPLLKSDRKKYSAVLMVGGGSSISEHSNAIEDFLDQNPDMLVLHASSKNALNFINVSNDQLFCLVGNEGHRLENVFGEFPVRGKCVLPPYPRSMGTYIPKVLRENSFELERIWFSDKFKDSHTSIALQVILDLEISQVYVSGYDAYKGEISQKEQELFTENQFLFQKFKQVKSIELVCLTPTVYGELKEASVYSIIG